MKLEFPEIKHKKSYEKLINAWWKFEDLSETSPWALFEWNNFEEFLEYTEISKTNCPRWVNAHLFFLVEKEKILWALQIRHTLWNDILKEFWGHIWYWISPEFRKKWYWNKILELWLIEVKKLWIEKILICCEENNIWSKKIIEKNWWVFEGKSNKKEFEKYWIFNRYWINLK